ncbi:MAG: excalibur calcium-binding domain-containing protein [Telluria sp.]|nr:excalibur calcium-binding domain-containing protein [Telluria sp.]
MKKIILVVILASLAWHGYAKYYRPSAHTIAATAVPEPDKGPIPDLAPVADAHFSCDGRKFCSQMRSCEEAAYFLKNCPDVKMDGNHDGVPCERQWCG